MKTRYLETTWNYNERSSNIVMGPKVADTTFKNYIDKLEVTITYLHITSSCFFYVTDEVVCGNRWFLL